ncbi:MAG: hypothetical protein KIT27_06845 [Legionellales bacterium]|nr:hypothetical protein [Legionellales bacterium]
MQSTPSNPQLLITENYCIQSELLIQEINKNFHPYAISSSEIINSDDTLHDIEKNLKSARAQAIENILNQIKAHFLGKKINKVLLPKKNALDDHIKNTLKENFRKIFEPGSNREKTKSFITMMICSLGSWELYDYFTNNLEVNLPIQLGANLHKKLQIQLKLSKFVNNKDKIKYWDIIFHALVMSPLSFVREKIEFLEKISQSSNSVIPIYHPFLLNEKHFQVPLALITQNPDKRLVYFIRDKIPNDQYLTQILSIDEYLSPSAPTGYLILKSDKHHVMDYSREDFSFSQILTTCVESIIKPQLFDQQPIDGLKNHEIYIYNIIDKIFKKFTTFYMALTLAHPQYQFLTASDEINNDNLTFILSNALNDIVSDVIDPKISKINQGKTKSGLKKFSDYIEKEINIENLFYNNINGIRYIVEGFFILSELKEINRCYQNGSNFSLTNTEVSYLEKIISNYLILINSLNNQTKLIIKRTSEYYKYNEHNLWPDFLANLHPNESDLKIESEINSEEDIIQKIDNLLKSNDIRTSQPENQPLLSKPSKKNSNAKIKKPVIGKNQKKHRRAPDFSSPDNESEQEECPINNENDNQNASKQSSNDNNPTPASSSSLKRNQRSKLRRKKKREEILSGRKKNKNQELNSQSRESDTSNILDEQDEEHTAQQEIKKQAEYSDEEEDTPGVTNTLNTIQASDQELTAQQESKRQAECLEAEEDITGSRLVDSSKTTENSQTIHDAELQKLFNRLHQQVKNHLTLAKNINVTFTTTNPNSLKNYLNQFISLLSNLDEYLSKKFNDFMINHSQYNQEETLSNDINEPHLLIKSWNHTLCLFSSKLNEHSPSEVVSELVLTLSDFYFKLLPINLDEENIRNIMFSVFNLGDNCAKKYDIYQVGSQLLCGPMYNTPLNDCDFVIYTNDDNFSIDVTAIEDTLKKITSLKKITNFLGTDEENYKFKNYQFYLYSNNQYFSNEISVDLTVSTRPKYKDLELRHVNMASVLLSPQNRMSLLPGTYDALINRQVLLNKKLPLITDSNLNNVHIKISITIRMFAKLSCATTAFCTLDESVIKASKEIEYLNSFETALWTLWTKKINFRGLFSFFEKTDFNILKIIDNSSQILLTTEYINHLKNLENSQLNCLRDYEFRTQQYPNTQYAGNRFFNNANSVKKVYASVQFLAILYLGSWIEDNDNHAKIISKLEKIIAPSCRNPITQLLEALSNCLSMKSNNNDNSIYEYHSCAEYLIKNFELSNYFNARNLKKNQIKS